jgi:putative endonuclease
MWTLYILLCADGTLYTGITNNLDKRFKDHLLGVGSKYTRSHKPLKILYSEQVESHSLALKRELQIKSWTRIQKINRLNLKISI